MIATPTQTEHIHQVFEAQKRHQHAVAQTDASERIQKLKRLREIIMSRRQDIYDALHNDFRKHPTETDLSEIYAVTSEINHAISHLRKWMRPHKVDTPTAFIGSSSYILYEPKGVCLIISPWNFPINLTFGPMVSAIAAGNTVMIKPSEHTPHSSSLMQEIVQELFEEKEVAVFQGAIETSTTLLALPFNHIFFTGSPQVGKIVMAAAAKHLASVTLELGGKSPTIIDDTVNIKDIVARLAWGKFLNTGQICVAPDYVYVHESKEAELLEHLQKRLKDSYGEDPKSSDSFARVINNRHFKRIKDLLEKSVEQGAKIVVGGQTDEADNYIAPTVVKDVPMDSPLMQEEIFGPVLPIITYRTLDEVIETINSKEKPLTMYIYSRSRANIKRLLRETSAGTSAVNHNVLHFLQNNMPFGGVNNSGIGKSHGKYGFIAFSNERGVYEQNLPSAMDLLFPPYDNLKQKLVDLTLKFF